MSRFKIILARANQGFFTQVYHTLQHLEDAEKEGKVPIVYWSGGIYNQSGGYNGKKTNNVWEYFFEPVSQCSFDEMYPGSKANQYGDFPKIKNKRIEFVKKFRNNSLSHEPKDCWNTLLFPPNVCLCNPNTEGRSYINKLINKHLKIIPIVQQKINLFIDQNMKNYYILSVHMRACNDHSPAQGHKIMTRYIKHIGHYLSDHKDENIRIFVATDLEKALHQIIKEYGDKVIYRKETTRSHNGNPLQYACDSKKKHKPPGAKVFEDVLIEAILLSHGISLIRGFSNVASFSTFFNPHIKNNFICKYNENDRKYLGI